MDPSALISITVAWAILVVVPGPDFLATAQAAAGTSRRAGIAVVAGIALGTTIWAVAAAVGLAAAIHASARIYDALRLAGAAYLLLFGLGLLRSARAGHGACSRAARPEPLSLRGAFLRGLLTDLSNPKAAVYFTSLFAAALPGRSDPGALAILVAAIPAIAALWYGSVAVLLATGPVLAAYRRAERWVLAVAGTLLAAFGARLVLE